MSGLCRALHESNDVLLDSICLNVPFQRRNPFDDRQHSVKTSAWGPSYPQHCRDIVTGFSTQLIQLRVCQAFQMQLIQLRGCPGDEKQSEGFE
jgi:hypothetical protein